MEGETREFGPYLDVVVEPIVKELRAQGFEVEQFTLNGDALCELRFRVSAKPRST